MRIGIDARLVYYNRAGIGEYIVQLAQALTQIETGNDRFVLLQSRKDKSAIVKSEKFGRKSLWTPSHNRFEQQALSFEISRLKMDLLHSPDFIPPFRRNCKSVITIHDLAFLLYPHFLTKESARYYGQIDQAWRKTDHIIAVSEATKQDSIRMLGVPEKKITVIHEAANPIYRQLPPGESTRYVKERYKIDQDFILFVSTIEPRKNLPGLLQAYRRAAGRLQTQRAAGAGRGPTLAVGKRCTRRSIGWIWKTTWCFSGASTLGGFGVQLYNAARVLVQPLVLNEGFGLTPPAGGHYLRHPSHCLSNNRRRPAPKWCGDAAMLMRPARSGGVTVAMMRVLTEKELRADLISKGLKRAKIFSWERTPPKKPWKSTARSVNYEWCRRLYFWLAVTNHCGFYY
jgi:glycosyltransferase involved in cell wall biosynthesis